jgi:hypothetical protein
MRKFLVHPVSFPYPTTRFSKALNQSFFLNVIGQVLQSYKPIGKIVALNISEFRKLDKSRRNKIFKIEWHRAFPEVNLSL